jgi:hypothetical protein
MALPLPIGNAGGADHLRGCRIICVVERPAPWGHSVADLQLQHSAGGILVFRELSAPAWSSIAALPCSAPGMPSPAAVLNAGKH